MKNTRKLFGIIVILAVIVLCMAFTACPEQSYTWRFENYTKETIVVTSSDLVPNSFELTGLSNPLLDDPTTQVATSKKSKLTIEWICKGKSKAYSEANVTIKSGSTTTFKEGSSAFANILILEYDQ